MFFSKKKKGTDPHDLDDRPLNLIQDQIPDIKPQLRHIDLQWVKETAVDNANLLSSAILAGTAVGLLLKRKVPAASFFVAGLVLQQILVRRKPELARMIKERKRKREDLKMERYAMKAQRGDYGKLEVIPFR
ncbi:hypothetical protein GMSM_03850 [Geomonas sp. Red276]